VLDRVRDFDKSKRRAVFNIQRLYLDFLEALGLREIREAGDQLQRNELPRLPTWQKHACGSCEMAGLCRKREP